MESPLSRVINNFHSEFFRSLEEESVAAFMQAHLLTDKQYDAPERISMLGQNRHALCESAFRKAAFGSGLEAHGIPTSPRGGTYSYVCRNGVYILRANIQVHCGTPRPSKFRKAYAAHNAWLNPLQLDLLREEITEIPHDKICAMVVISAYPPRQKKPEVPAYVGIGIPNSNLSQWLSLKAINEVLAIYHDMEGQEKKQKDAVIEVKDRAIPRLKEGA